MICRVTNGLQNMVLASFFWGQARQGQGDGKADFGPSNQTRPKWMLDDVLWPSPVYDVTLLSELAHQVIN